MKRIDAINAVRQQHPEYGIHAYAEMEGGPPNSGITVLFTRNHKRWGRLYMEVIIRDNIMFDGEKLAAWLPVELNRMFEDAVRTAWANSAQVRAPTRLVH